MTYQELENKGAGDLVDADDYDRIENNFIHVNSAFDIPLELPGRVLANLLGAAHMWVDSTAGGTPTVARPILAFDASTDEGRGWNKRMGRGYGGTLVLAVQYYMGTANSSAGVVLGALIARGPDGGTATATGYDTVNLGTISVPDAANVEDAATITLTNVDSVVAGEPFAIAIYRDVSDAGDDATGDFNVTQLGLNYSLGGS